ncbi:capsid triplex subunit 1 [Cervid alphaherpesvirus 2]|uniref:Capsid triplex subunit 1 n=1 Tax=Cervid alphaherpesvirus 2 TaxID=365327 RepID=A0A455JIX9_9ALPH|nr:capsid triplex subunit 1 [Cervid alphaherpesvirus 2]AVT50741.1 capsid triplex subunit 1 [Cervid alphaherpesvirus 2]
MAAPEGSSYVQIGSGLRMRLPAAAPPFAGVPAAAAQAAQAARAAQTAQSVTAPAAGLAAARGPRGGGGGYNPWAAGMLHVSDAAVTIQNMAGIQVITPRQVVVDTPAGAALLSAGGQPHIRLTRQVTLTDFCDPRLERPGAPVLTLRHPADLVGMAAAAAPPGRQFRDAEEAWRELGDACGAGAAPPGGLRASLVSFSFLAAACAGEYANRPAAEALRAHVLANAGDRRAQLRLDRFYACMQAMIRCHAFPHRALGCLGGLLAWTAQDRLASVTAIVCGAQEAARTDLAERPRSTAHVPACAFLDVDAELRLEPAGAKLVYLVFVYAQRLEHEGFRAHVAVSRLGETAFASGLSYLLHRTRAENVLRGTAGDAAAAGGPDAAGGVDEFPLPALAGDPAAYRCPVSRLHDPEATVYLPRWAPSAAGRPTRESCMYAAFMRLGSLPHDAPRITCRSERYLSCDVPVVRMEGLVWGPGEWVECFY